MVCYHVNMVAPMHKARFFLAGATLIATSVAVQADTFGGFSGVDKPYLVNQDRVCNPLAASATTGTPSCDKATTDVIAHLSIKDPLPQRGPKAAFAATAAGKTLTITRGVGGEAVVTWTAVDPITKVIDVFASQYSDRVAVAYSTRRMGKDVTDVIAFEVKGGGAPGAKDPAPPTGVTPAVTAVEDPRVVKAATAARKAPKGKQLAAWQAVLAVDAQHAEALYQIAVLQAGAKKPAEALASLGALATSARADAIEWLVEARYAAAFAALRAEPVFRKNVGLDRKGATPYERLMGFGGQWEQTGTSCDKPEVKFTATRDRVVRIRVKSTCAGAAYDLPFKGTWMVDGDKVTLTFATRGKAVAADDQAVCIFEAQGDEDSLRCALGKDIDFVVLPTRR